MYMSSRKLDKATFEPVIIESRKYHLALESGTVHFRKNGIEFHSPVPVNPWVEMTVELESPGDGQRVKCTGIVVACDGSRHQGYAVSMIFTGMDRQASSRLGEIAFSALA
jgi:hypothetical protein